MSRADLVELFRAASNPKPRAVNVPGLGDVYIRTMTAYDADQMRRKLETLPKDDGCNVGRTLAFVLCDEDGESLFDAAAQADAELLSRLPQGVAAALMRAANEGIPEGKV